MRRSGSIYFAIGLLLAALVSRPQVLAAAAPAKDWNILVITSDEHNPKILGAAGHPIIQTPGIDRIAREGLICNRMYAADPICIPRGKA